MVRHSVTVPRIKPFGTVWCTYVGTEMEWVVGETDEELSEEEEEESEAEAGDDEGEEEEEEEEEEDDGDIVIEVPEQEEP